MTVRRVILTAVVLLASADAWASDHRYAAFFAPSYLNAQGSSLNLGGLQLGGEVTMGEGRRWGLGGDLSVNGWGGSKGTEDPAQISFSAGVRYALSGGHDHHNSTFVNVGFFGFVHRKESNELIGQATAFSLGLGHDWTPRGHLWGTRIQVDWVQPYSPDLGRGIRVAVGLVVRFPGSVPCKP